MPNEAFLSPEWQLFQVRSFNRDLGSLESQCESAEDGVRRLERLLQEIEAVKDPPVRLFPLERTLKVYEDVTSGRNRLSASLAGVVRSIEDTIDRPAKDALLARAAALTRRADSLAPSLDAMRKSLDRQSTYAAANGLAAEMDGIERAVAAYRGTLLKLEPRLDA